MANEIGLNSKTEWDPGDVAWISLGLGLARVYDVFELGRSTDVSSAERFHNRKAS